MSNERDHKAFTDALEQFATQYGYKVTNIGLSRPPIEFIGRSATDLLTRLNGLPITLEVSFRDMMDSEEVTEDSEKTELPEWCKVGEWVWVDPKKIQGGFGYEKIKNIYGIELRFESGIGVYFSQNIKQVRLRPYNTEEMKALVGKVVEDRLGNRCLISLYTVPHNEIVVFNAYCSAEKLLELKYTIDGNPCGVLEHLENGEWVE